MTRQVEALLAELEGLEQEARAFHEAETAFSTAELERVAGLEAALTAADSGSPAVEDIWDLLQQPLRTALSQVSEAIERAEKPSVMNAYSQWESLLTADASLFEPGAQAPPASEAMEHLEELERDLLDKLTELEVLEIELRLADVERDVAIAGRLYRIRLTALHELPLARRLQATSWAEDAPKEIRFELDLLKLFLRLQVFRIKGVLAAATAGLGGLLAALLAGTSMIKLLLVVVIWRWVQRLRPQIIERLRERGESLERRQGSEWSSTGVDFLEAIAPWGIYLLGVASLQWVLVENDSLQIFLPPILNFMYVYGVYRLAVDLGVGAITSGMQRSGTGLGPEHEKRLERGIRWVARVATAVALVLVAYSFRLGKGVLYGKMRAFGWSIIAVALLLMIWKWRGEIGRTFLAVRAHGWLADRVRSSTDRPSSLLVSPLAFFWLCARAIHELVKGIVFRFDRTRSASAFMSRRRLARVAQQRGYAEGDLEALPRELVDSLEDTITVADLEFLGNFPEMDAAQRNADAWREEKVSTCMLLAGEEGLGKVAWLDRFTELAGGAKRIRLERRLLSPGKVRSWLGEQLLDEGKAPTSHDALVEKIREGPRRIVILEGAENLFLATVNGYRALNALAPLIDDTRHHLLWLLTMKGLAWNHLKAAGKELSFLRRRFELEPWGQDEMTALLEHRIEPLGVEADYAELMVVEGRKEDESTRQKMGRQAFQNLLWDFSGGNPQVALHYFARSLEPTDGGGLKVRPFRTPPQPELSSIGDEALFLLAAVMRHGTLSASQAAVATDYPVGRVEGLFLRLLDLGTVTETNGIYRVTTPWRASVLRILRHRNILVS